MHKGILFALTALIAVLAFSSDVGAQSRDAIFQPNLHSSVRFGVGREVDYDTLKILAPLPRSGEGQQTTLQPSEVPATCTSGGITKLASADGAFQQPIASWQEFSITTYALFVANFESVRVHCGTSFFDTHLYLEHRSQGQWKVLGNPKDQLLNEIFWEWIERPAEKTGYGIHRRNGSAVVYFGAEDDTDFAVAFVRGNAVVAKIFPDDEVAEYYVEGLSKIGFRSESGPSNAGEPQVVSLATQVDPENLVQSFREVLRIALRHANLADEIALQVQYGAVIQKERSQVLTMEQMFGPSWLSDLVQNN